MFDLRPLVFLDTETTGLSLDDDIWDFAAITRVPGQPDVEHQFFVVHDQDRALRLPEPFLSDYHSRYDPIAALSKAQAAYWWRDSLKGAVIVGAVPSFDTTRMELAMRASAAWAGSVTWHYQVVDVETLVLGYLVGLGDGACAGPWVADSDVEALIAKPIPLPPWDSHTLTGMVGIKGEGEHTAIGDARWARDVFDKVNPWPQYERVAEPDADGPEEAPLGLTGAEQG